MRSIRLSLIVYFLLLLSAALGAVSFLFYRGTARALQEKQDTNRQLLRTQHDDRRRDEAEKFDTELLGQAHTLATLAQWQFEANRLLPLMFSPTVGVMSSAAAPQGYALIPLWLAETHNDRLWNELGRATAANIQLNKDMLRSDTSRSADYYQINSLRSRPLRSDSLADNTLPFDREHFRSIALLGSTFDNIDLNGQHLRRVQLKAPMIMRFRFVQPTIKLPTMEPSRPRGPGRGPPQPQPTRFPPDAPQQYEPPAFFIQCANDISARDHSLADMEAALERELHDLDAESRTILANLRSRMLWISLATFAAIFVGGSALIGLGLKPLRRLSDAVSRVSEKDFALQYDGPPPPHELEPIIERLHQTLDLLRRAFDREKQATADISHELRTPLAALLTTLEVSLRKARGPDEYRETIAECRDLVKQMTQLVQRLLTLSWLDARADRLRPEPVDATELAEQCAAVVRPLARASGLKFELHRDAPVTLTTDPDKLREVMANLMHNAVEYTKPSGSIDVSVRAAGTGLDLEVRDTGIGIAREHRDRIFERFFRADPSRQAVGMHAGLGLAIVRGYVDLMGGTISVESEPGRGSTFRVRIPSSENTTRT